ncbi:MAG: HAMP domain-containing protein, partial [Armatimonadota bacterium]|nr:HAMP domain-containing protein [Armatimonadota bacterium]
MQWFLNLPTRTKLFLCFGLLLTFLIAMIVAAFVSMLVVQSNHTAVVRLVELRDDLNRQRAQLLTMLSKTDRTEQEAIKREIETHDAEVNKSLDEIGTLSGQDANSLNQLKATLNDFRKTRTKRMDLIISGQRDQAQQFNADIQETRYETLQTIAKTLGDNAQKRANTTARNASIIFLIVGLLAVLTGLLMAMLLNRIIANPLRDISGVAEKIAAGDLNVEMPSNNRRDEVGVLAATFSRMTRSLQGMAGVAEQIADGDLQVQVKPQSDRDVLGHAFVRMTQSLREMAGVAEQMATGDLSARIKAQSDKDVLGNAFVGMTQSLQQMAGVAEQIAEGDLRVQVKPQSERDALGTAFTAMVANLQRMIADLAEAANVLGSASTEIVASTTQLASTA